MMKAHPISALFISSFTVADDDPSLPRVTSIIPANNSTNVPADIQIQIKFSEPITTTSILTPNLITLVQTTFGQSVPLTLTISPDRTMVTADHPLLTPGFPYRLNVRSDLTDDDGNELLSAASSSFTVAPPDTTGPKVANTQPAEGAANVSLASILAVEFNEPIDPESLNGIEPFTLFEFGVGFFPVTSTLENGNRRVIFTPESPLNPATEYAIVLSADITDPRWKPAHKCRWFSARRTACHFVYHRRFQYHLTGRRRCACREHGLCHHRRGRLKLPRRR